MIRKGMFIGNRYEILEKVGSGGMSDVYKARCHKLNRLVAIKVLKPEFSEDKNFVSKFRVEAQNAAGLSHPNIVSVYDVGEDQGMYYIVMEFIEGITLKQYIARKGKLSVKEAVSIAIQVAQGIECAHNNRIIHRDIKPQNIIISRDGKVKVTDFGIARAASVNTHTTNAMGSVHYISPEQALGRYIDEKSDIYSLGITMYEMLTGHVPFDGDSTVTIALQHIQNQVPDIKDEIPDIPVSVEKIVLKCTQNKADKRYLKISSLISDLKHALINPYEDFVQLKEDDPNGTTVMITKDEMAVIRGNAENTEKEVEQEEKGKDPFEIGDEKGSKTDKIITIVGISAVIVFFVVAIIFIHNMFSDDSDKAQVPSSTHEETSLDASLTVVPEVLNLNETGAKQELLKNALGIRYEYAFDDTVEKGYVCKQSEEPGSIVDRNSTITVTISNGAERVDLPDGIVGGTMNNAIDKLEDAGFKYEIKYQYSYKEIGTVLSMYPDGKVAVSRGTTVELTVSRGEQSSNDGIPVATVPDLRGKSQKDAEATIRSSGFIVGTVQQVFDENVKKGKVIRMTVKPGNTLPKGASIGLLVSKGSENPETKPSDETTKPSETSKQGAYSGSYTFALEDLKDANGNKITSGNVTIYIDGVKAPVDSKYAKVEQWRDDYKYTIMKDYSGEVVLQLCVDDVKIIEANVELK